MGKRRTYSDDFKASAVLLLEAAGWPDSEGASQRVANKLKIERRTLERWAKKESGPPPDELVRKKKAGLIEGIDEELLNLLLHLAEVRADASYRDAAVSFGILVDKRALLSGDSTENVQQTIRVESVGLSSVEDRETPDAAESDSGTSSV